MVGTTVGSVIGGSRARGWGGGEDSPNIDDVNIEVNTINICRLLGYAGQMVMSPPPKRPKPPRKKPAGRYHHGELARALIDATLGIVAREGTAGVSLSAAARKVGVSPQAVYNHFRDKSALLAAAAEEVIVEVHERMRQARDAASSPGQAFEEVGVAYVRFAATRRAQFRLWSAPELRDTSSDTALAAAHEATFQVLLDIVRECQRARVLRDDDPERLALEAWAMAHGLATLVVDGPASHVFRRRLAPASAHHVSGETASRSRGELDEEAIGEAARAALRTLFRGLRHPEAKPPRLR
jgi:AcrR family transcriptional regulator